MFALALALLAAHATLAGEARLEIRDIPEGFSIATGDGPNTLPAPAAGTFLVAGSFGPADFAVADPAQVRALDADGRVLPLAVESATLLAEFGEISGMRIAFELPAESLARGLPRLEWGADVTNVTRLVDRFVLPAAAMPAAVRTFTIAAAAGSAPEGPPQFATLEVIADSRADTYYLWYLLPIAMVFALLAVRKAVAR